MAAALDPVIAEIIPKLPLRVTPMTPQSARESLRALAAARRAAGSRVAFTAACDVFDRAAEFGGDAKRPADFRVLPARGV